jgi:uncharacterized SAM-binding protein YcdF (DUF218 family)
MIYLHKILPVFLLPTGLVLGLLLLGLISRRRSPIWAALLLFWLCSTPLLSDRLIAAVEQHGQRLDPGTMPRADAIVVLSGMLKTAPGPAAISEWGEASDRFWGGLDLYRAGKAPRLIFTGGWLPWQTQDLPEGERLRAIARAQGIPPSAITVTGKVNNTAAEAQAVTTLLPPNPTLLLVTSAFHMPRAQHLFQQTGATVIPYPVDFQTGPSQPFNPLTLLPSAGAFQQTEMAWRELIGRAYYGV